MPNTWTGTTEERWERLERAGRRCDASNRHCTRSAVDLYTLLPADGDFTPLPGATPVQKKCCGFHRAQFIGNGVWHHVSTEKLSTRWSKPGDKPYQRGRPAA